MFSRWLLYAGIAIFIVLSPSVSTGKIPGLNSLPPLFIANWIIVGLIGEVIYFLFLRNKQSLGKNEVRVIGGRLYYQGLSRPINIFQPVQVEETDQNNGKSERYRIELYDKVGKLIGTLRSNDEEHMNLLAHAINSGIAETTIET